MNQMPIEDMIAIKHRMSLVTAGMTVEQLHEFHSKGADAMRKLMDKIRADNQSNVKKTSKAG